MRAIRLLSIAATLWLAGVSAAWAGGPARLDIGFGDGLFSSTDPATRDLWFGRAVETGSSLVRINVNWARVAPAQPPIGFDAADPGSAGYDWTATDAAVRSAAARGLRIMITADRAPRWAQGADRPPGAEAGTWKPWPAAFGAFGRALATRYSGSFADPLSPAAALPRVRYFEVWNEPNLSNYLSPQAEGRRWVGADLYRGLLNSFYAGVKGAQPDATVIAGSLAPFGDPPGGARTPPVEFLRGLLCLKGARLLPVRCPEPARFDVLSDHPIAVGSPSDSAGSPLDVTTPDLGRLTEVLRRAEQTGRVAPRSRKPLWVTEFWYDSNPPDPHGVPLWRQARWYAQDLYMFWKQGASAAIALQLRDSPEGKGYPFTTQSGAYFLDGSAKPSQTAFRFPLVARREGRRQGQGQASTPVSIWGIAPGRGTVHLQARAGGRWRGIGTVRARGRSLPFQTTLRLPPRVLLRARLGSQLSLPWRQR